MFHLLECPAVSYYVATFAVGKAEIKVFSKHSPHTLVCGTFHSRLTRRLDFWDFRDKPVEIDCFHTPTRATSTFPLTDADCVH
jgi:hypothetical protein